MTETSSDPRYGLGRDWTLLQVLCDNLDLENCVEVALLGEGVARWP